MAHLTLHLFGSPQVELDGNLVKVDRHKAIGLLAYLAVNPERHSRNQLATLLWPEYDQRRARAALRRILTSLNKLGLNHWLAADRETICLEQTGTVWTDVNRFQHQVEGCLSTGQFGAACLPSLTEAVGLYQADFLAGFSLRDSAGFDEWQLLQSENLRQTLARALAELVNYHLGQYEFELAMTYSQRWLTVSPLSEMAHRYRMQLYLEQGERTAAVQQYQECVQLLETELGIGPSAETVSLYEQIQHETFHGLNGTIPSPTPTVPKTGRLHNFPAQPTPFLGRQPELTAIGERLQADDCRLLTLTGPGGMGKTRLALQAAQIQQTNFPDGLYFIPLNSVRSSDFLVAIIAENLALSFDGHKQPCHHLMTYLQDKRLLLVLDNFEHLMSKVSLLGDILSHAPQVTLLVTSRERMNLQGEWTFELQGMSYPLDEPSEPIEAYSSVTLFLDRAARADAAFTLTEAEKPYVARICQLVGGVPLGIELAASWVRVLSCQEIVAEIEWGDESDGNLDFLTTSLRDVPERHRNLRHVFGPSWQLLSAEEKQVFSSLSVFRGLASREAIQAVTGADLWLISSLVDKSLLSRTGQGRYEMHSLLRRYALEKLRQTPGLSEQAHDRHCDYYAAFLQQQENRLKGVDQRQALADIGEMIEDIRAAWSRAVAHRKIAQLEQAALSLWHFYAVYSQFQEGVEAFGEAVAKLQEMSVADDSPRMQALMGRMLSYLGWCLLRQGVYEQAKAVLHQSIALLHQHGREADVAASLQYLGILNGELGQAVESEQLLQESLDIYKKGNYQWDIAWSLSNLALITSDWDETRQVKAKKMLEKSLTIYQAIGNSSGVAKVLNNLGYIAYKQGDFSTAKQYLQEGLTLRRQTGYPRGIVVSLNNLGHVYGAAGEYEASQQYYYESLQLAQEIHTVPLTLAALGGLAVPFARLERLEQAILLLNLVLSHPASDTKTRHRATLLFEPLQPRLSTGLLASLEAQAQAGLANLEGFVAEILAEWRATARVA